MKVIVTGATGFVGSHLVARLLASGHAVKFSSRQPKSSYGGSLAHCHPFRWQPAKEDFPARELVGCDAVIHLLGEPVAGLRWTAAKKRRIYDSRVASTNKLTTALVKCRDDGPRVLIQASATGFYGDTGDRAASEASPPGDDFLARVCRDWELAGQQVEAAAIRWVAVRTGLVLGGDGGFLQPLLPAFKAGLGATIGKPSQWMSWIHQDDLTAVYLAALNNTNIKGAVNAVSPDPVSQEVFFKTLAESLNRPLLLRFPAFFAKAAFGEMAALFLQSSRVLPGRLQKEGFGYGFPALPAALADCVRNINK